MPTAVGPHLATGRTMNTRALFCAASAAHAASSSSRISAVQGAPKCNFPSDTSVIVTPQVYRIQCHGHRNMLGDASCAAVIGASAIVA
eukprot:5381514-Karenia_brevis.AAC.1